MTVSEVCRKLKITRQGLYWLLGEHQKTLGNHARKKANGRWELDDAVVGLLEEIQEASPRVKIRHAPHVTETIRGMELTIERLTTENELLKLKAYQGLLLLDAMDDILRDFKNLDPSVRRAIAVQIKYYKDYTTDKALRRELKNQKNR